VAGGRHRHSKRAGWLVYHVHDSRTQEWGTDPGFPDLVMVRDDRILFVEIKREHGRVARTQTPWLQALDLPGIEVYIWRPSHEDIVRQVLA